MVINKEDDIKISKGIVLYKFILGVGELSIAFSLIFFGRNIGRIYQQYRVRELLEDPHDRLIKFIQGVSPYLNQNRTYFIGLLLILGITKVIGAIGLWKNKEWGLDLIVGLFVILIPFDMIDLIIKPSFIRVVYFLINVLITFYLLEFKPHKYLRRLKKKYLKRS